MKLPINYDKSDSATRRRAREEYIRLQNGICIHCGGALNGPPTPDILAKAINKKLFPPDFFQYPIHLHHNHSTGVTIGAVHNKCNAVLWQYYGI